MQCPVCHSNNTELMFDRDFKGFYIKVFTCFNCGEEFEEDLS